VRSTAGITEEDWRNRKKSGAYKSAVHDMVSRTSSAVSPWHIIAANDKQSARVEVLKTVVKAMERALGSTAKRARKHHLSACGGLSRDLFCNPRYKGGYTYE